MTYKGSSDSHSTQAGGYDSELQVGIDELAYRLMLSYPKQNGVTPMILFTSMRPGEGKTTLASAVARSLRRISGEAILLADAHAQRPAIHTLFRLPAGTVGLFDVLRGDEGGLNAVLESSRSNRTTILTVGTNPDPALLCRERAVQILRRAAMDYRFVVLDGGTARSGGSTLGQHVDGVVIVINSSQTRREVVQGGLRSMQLPEGRVVGAILNRRPRYIPRLFYRGL